ncbi:nitroreductase family protein [Rhodalgimonas zhirmunskyi]|uniref:Nitroreductase family protein n=1 Tax=Rhodalgimonas zhirmunskyi TaxID=2964767 RepID=A0AAJ1UD66_9RHOB|nr:nitroreductase family protein [Rhodoalgimonas zhirmunskyi]MDQ2095803.1 nitroreductase family protein [Rhodoalgimonas zhirmunskyi]
MTESYEPLPLSDWIDRPDDEIAARARDMREEMARRHTIREFSTRPVAREVIEDCIRTAGLAPSGANHQPWHFVAIADPEVKAKIRAAAEEEEARFYAGAAGDEWLSALEPIGTGVSKPHLEDAPWLIVIFAQRYGLREDGSRFKHYYVPESSGIASGFLITALHRAGLATLTHTPNPMKFLSEICGRPDHEKALMIVAVGHPASDATVPAKALKKKPLEEISTFLG